MNSSELRHRIADGMRTIAIVGGGASGVVVAVDLLRQARDPLTIRIIDPREQLGLGVAYSTPFKSHVLNVPAGNMSAFPDAPAHFLEWLRASGRPDLSPASFARRSDYGAYLQATLAEAKRLARPGVTVEHVRAKATRLSQLGGSFEFATDRGDLISANAVVVALGNSPSGNPLPPGSAESYSAWSPDSVRQLAPDATVVLIGAGLTAIDVCLGLNEIGHRGPVYLVSRRGLLPRVHAPNAPRTPWTPGERSRNSLRALYSEITRSARNDLAEGRTWHGRIDALRPHTQDIWRGLSLAEKRRFFRHVRPYWDVHRHRMAPEVHETIEAMRSRNQLHIIAGRILSATANGRGGTEVRISGRGSAGEISVAADRLINCTVPESDSRRFQAPLIAQMVADGLARYDPLYLGIDTTKEGALIRKDAAVLPRVFAIGPLLKGALWESIAMPEIRNQAAALAKHLLPLRETAAAPAP
ncbi:MAG: FAD/NAD(P)-binding protein [Candidatus Binataceae bacterium]